MRPFEAGEGAFSYKKSHRTILVAVGCLFLVLSVGGLVAAIMAGQLSGALPVVVFFVVALVCVVVGGLGSDRAVAKIWGNR
nr:hypothetical protein [Pseudomaricurvus sp. HS19]